VSNLVAPAPGRKSFHSQSGDKNEKTVDELKAEVERRSHPAAKIFPLLIDTDADAWEKFCADIATKGLQTPILIDRPVTEVGRLTLDGRNRELACLIHGIEPKYEVINVSDSAAVARVISANLLRRHDDVSVRAAQLAKLLEMLRVENFPTPRAPVAAAAAGMSDRTLRDAERLRKKDPELADQVARGNISGHAAGHIAALPSEQRDELKKKIGAAGNKKQAKGIVREAKRRKKPQLGTLKMPDRTGRFSTLLAVLECLPKLANELRKLKRLPHPLSVGHARELRVAVMAAKEVDARELHAAAEELIEELDRIIAKGPKNVEQPAERPDGTADVAADPHQQEAALP
jgi:hypothetical protein